ncbi:MAG: 6-oxocyclohex-1-ene-1-carbonyl-CoA hydratase [Chloroflexi bacterium]|jgi:6-oxocyclohex-1-ene-carbonyl-CoA hydrolase|nr:6-oxocyclohex-1-ene-1-carbonyl-CoA hydratase [Chloroflexota bacterium]MBT7081441.1 6-oxocyclohex-1-ene-1-carbonyl-CoA hydratase [Chloroflexota bacterium]MBT7289834.1 6-oxocyclohex-1-ene-1-carbonyl-CoA hydratase [Chloroflexota bacterium]
MSLDWLPREGGVKDHNLWGMEHFGTEAPCTMYEEKPILDPAGNPVDGLYSAWITLNNPAQYNSYTTEMVKGVIAGFHRAQEQRNVVAVVLTGAGSDAFCTGGNTKEYSEYYAQKPTEYQEYMTLFNAMVDAILLCQKPVIRRVNGMSVAGGQEIGGACDLSISADTAIFGQAGPRHGSAPVGGSSDFLPWALSIEDAMWNCISCEMWSSYKMLRKNYISKVVKVLKHDGKFIRNPRVITDKWLDDGEMVYGEMASGDEAKAAKALAKECTVDFSLLDAEINKMMWTFTNLFPHCLTKSIIGIRQKKKYFWDMNKSDHIFWLGTNMNSEAFLGFTAFNTKKITGQDTIDFIKYRKMIGDGHAVNDDLFEAVLGTPQQK